MKFAHNTLSVKDKARLNQAKNIAATSDCTHQHGCVAVKGGRTVGVGVNAYRNARSLFDIIPDEARSIHAEEACLRAVGSNARGATLYIARVNRFGEEMMSRPCARCMKQIKESGVKRIVYTIDSNLELG